MENCFESTLPTSRYQYRKLDFQANEIRLIELLPGRFEDDIHLGIHHATLTDLKAHDCIKTQITTYEVRKTLPAGWTAMKTLEGRFLFERVREYSPEEPYDTSWQHPTTGAELSSDAAHQGLDPVGEPAYEALSYVWGAAGGESTVHIHKSESPRKSSAPHTETLEIRQNLECALRHLRYPTKARMLWIDALSIDQSDVTERGHQVRIMRDIYELARRVIIWLGPEQSRSDLAMSALSNLGQQAELTVSRTSTAPSCPNPTWSRPAGLLPYDNITWGAIAGLLRRSWFERVWVVQEAKLANRHSIVHCGSVELPLYRLQVALSCAVNKTSLPGTEMRALLYNAWMTVQPRSKSSLLRTISHLSQKSCSDQRDKIYGALGITPPSITRKIVPKYSLAVEDVYKDLVLTCIEETRRVEVLCFCDLAMLQMERLSWVPDWSKGVPTRISFAGHASGSSMSSVSVTHPQAHTLCVRGVRCSSIVSVGKRATRDSAKLKSLIREWAPVDLKRRMYITGESLLDAFVKTIGKNLFQERYTAWASFPKLAEETALVEKILSYDKDEMTSEPHFKFADFHNQSFFTMESGHIGISASEVAATDVICVLLGCSHPIVLRPRTPSGFLVVGHCYVHGLMDAEGLIGPLFDEWVIEVEPTRAGTYGYRFHNISTNTITHGDPRLGLLPAEWEVLNDVQQSAGLASFVRYRNKFSGDIIDGDPRLLPDSLRKRGVELETFELG